ncbi:hypothetical protein V8C35DRAFT_287566 [Trichoderma chlorosporum]
MERVMPRCEELRREKKRNKGGSPKVIAFGSFFVCSLLGFAGDESGRYCHAAITALVVAAFFLLLYFALLFFR